MLQKLFIFEKFCSFSKMAPHMAATVLCSSVFVMFLFVFPVFCFSNTISFTREELLNTPLNLLPDFDHSGVLVDIVVGGAAVLFRRWMTRRRGEASRRAREASSARIKNTVA